MIRALFGKFLSELSQMPSARPQEVFAENQFFYQRNYVFLLEIWICSDFFCPVANKLSRWSKTAMHVFRGNICGNFTLKKCFHQLFGLWAEKLGLFMEKQWHVCQNCSISVRPKKFPEKYFWIADMSPVLNVDQGEFGIYRKKLGWGFKTKFYVSKGTLTEQCFWQKLFKVSGFSAEIWSFWNIEENFSSGLPSKKKMSRGTY